MHHYQSTQRPRPVDYSAGSGTSTERWVQLLPFFKTLAGLFYFLTTFVVVCAIYGAVPGIKWSSVKRTFPLSGYEGVYLTPIGLMRGHHTNSLVTMIPLKQPIAEILEDKWRDRRR